MNTYQPKKDLGDIQDELNVAKDYIAAVFLICEKSMPLNGDERGAACTVANAAREKLEEIDADLEMLKQGGFDARR